MRTTTLTRSFIGLEIRKFLSRLEDIPINPILASLPQLTALIPSTLLPQILPLHNLINPLGNIQPNKRINQYNAHL